MKHGWTQHVPFYMCASIHTIAILMTLNALFRTPEHAIDVHMTVCRLTHTCQEHSYMPNLDCLNFGVDKANIQQEFFPVKLKAI